MFLYDAEIIFNVCEELHWYLDPDCIESVVAFGKMAIFTIVIQATHEHEEFLTSSGIFFSFFSVLKFPLYKFCTSLIKLFQDTFEATVNKIISLFFKVCLLFMYSSSSQAS